MQRIVMTAKADPGQLPDGAGRAVGADNIVISGGTGPTGIVEQGDVIALPSRRQETSWCPRLTCRPAAANAVSRIFSVRGCGILTWKG